MQKELRFLAAGFVLTAALFVSTTAAHAQTFQVLHFFQNTDGANPRASLIEGSDGNFYGTTYAGGTNGAPSGFGTVFRMTSNGIVTTLVSFDRTNNGANPYAELARGSDGNLYGTTLLGGPDGYNLGTVFQLTNGLLNTLISFHETNGANPNAGLFQASDGSFYGTTRYGGTNIDNGSGYGTVFRMTNKGLLTTLVHFNNINGAFPRATLRQGSNGDLFGTTDGGGTNYGSVFRLTTNGVLSTLFSFSGTNLNNGRNPNAGVVIASDGNLYGTTFVGGVSNMGTIYKLTTNGALTPIVSFNGTNGANSRATLIQASDGNLYGTASTGGANGAGTVFQVTTNGVLTTLVSFDFTNGSSPLAGVVQGSDGNLYGTTFNGGTNGYGTVFRILLSLPPTLKANQVANQILLSWPTNSVGFTLQSTLNLNPTVIWTDSTNTAAVVGGQFVVTNNISGSARFYRLRK